MNVGRESKEKNTKTVEEVAFIGRPPEAVFALLTDLEGIGRWMPGVTVAQLFPGSLDVGSKVEMNEKYEPAYEFEVVAYEPPELFALWGHTDAGPYTMTWRLLPEAGSTRVRYSYEVDWETFVAGVAAHAKRPKRPDDAKLEAAARKRMQIILENLKRLLEGEDRHDYCPPR